MLPLKLTSAFCLVHANHGRAPNAGEPRTMSFSHGSGWMSLFSLVTHSEWSPYATDHFHGDYLSMLLMTRENRDKTASLLKVLLTMPLFVCMHAMSRLGHSRCSALDRFETGAHQPY